MRFPQRAAQLAALLILATSSTTMASTCRTSLAQLNHLCCDASCAGQPVVPDPYCHTLDHLALKAIKSTLARATASACTSSAPLSTTMKQALQCYYPPALLDAVTLHRGCTFTSVRVCPLFYCFHIVLHTADAVVDGTNVMMNANFLGASDDSLVLAMLARELTHVWESQVMGGRDAYIGEFWNEACASTNIDSVPLEVEAVSVASYVKTHGSCTLPDNWSAKISRGGPVTISPGVSLTCGKAKSKRSCKAGNRVCTWKKRKCVQRVV